MTYGIPHFRIVAYAYDADHHCVDCASKAHADGSDPGTDTTDINGIPVDAEDSEGNEVHPVFAGDMDSDTVASCSDCRKTICLCCGDTVDTRWRGAVRLRCTNCRTSYRVGDS